MTACRLVAFADGPNDYIHQFDAAGITHVELRANGFIDLGSYGLSGAAQTIRYYIDPADETGAVYAADADTGYHIDLHRGNGFEDLGQFDLDDPPIGGAITGVADIVLLPPSLAAAGMVGGGVQPGPVLTPGGIPSRSASRRRYERSLIRYPAPEESEEVIAVVASPSPRPRRRKAGVSTTSKMQPLQAPRVTTDDDEEEEALMMLLAA